MPRPDNIPDGAWAIYEAVMAQLKDSDPEMADEDRAKRAWGAVKNAGWHKEGDKWTTTKKADMSASGNETEQKTRGGETQMGQIKGLPSFMEGMWQGKGMSKPEVYDRSFVDELACTTLEWMDATGQTPKVFIGGHDESLQEKIGKDAGLADVLCYGRASGVYSSFSKTDDGMKKTMFVDLDDVPDEVIALVDGKQLPDVSISIGQWNGRPIMEHVCLVGIEQPGVSGLSKVGTFTDVQPQYFVALSEIEQAKKAGIIKRTKGAVKQMFQRPGDNQEPHALPVEFTDALAEHMAGLKQLVDDKIGGLEKDQKVRDSKTREAGVKQFVDGLFGERNGFMLAPALKSQVEAVLMAADDSQKVSFTAPGQKEATTTTVAEALRSLLSDIEMVRVGDGKQFTIAKAPGTDKPDYEKIGKGIASRQFTGVAAPAEDISTIVAATMAVIEAQKAKK